MIVPMLSDVKIVCDDVVDHLINLEDSYDQG